MSISVLRMQLFGILIGASCVSTALANLDPQAFGGYYEDALIRYDQGDYAAAVIQLKNAIQQRPKHLPSHILLGKTYLELDNGAAAESILLTARRLGADDELILTSLGEAYLLQGKLPQLINDISGDGLSRPRAARIKILQGKAYLALQDYAQAAQAYLAAQALQPNNAQAFIGRAQVHLLQGNLDRAEDLIDIATSKAPDHAEVWYTKGELRRLQLDLAGALSFYAKAIAADPNHLLARISRAATYIDLQQPEAAQIDIDLVLKQQPKHPQAAYLHAMLLVHQNDVVGAKAALHEAAGHLAGFENSNHAPSILQLGVIHFAQGNLEAAQTHLSRYLKLDPQHLGARKLLGRIFLQKRKATHVIELLEPALATASDDVQLNVLLGNAYMLEKQHAKATRLLEKAVHMAPQHTALRTQLAMNHLASGKRSLAIADLESVLEKDANATQAALILAQIHLQQGNYPAGLQLAQQIIERSPADPLGYNIAGVAHLQHGDLANAETSFQQALQHQAQYSPALLNLAKLDLQNSKLRQAEQRLQVILASDAKHIGALTGLAQIALQEQRNMDAMAWLEKIRALNPHALEQQLQLITLYLQDQQAARALTIAQALEANFPTSIPVLLAQARALVALGKPNKALVIYKKLSHLNTDSAAHLHAVAKLQIAAGDVGGARYSLDQALRTDPKFLPAHATLTNLEMQSGNLDRAIQITHAARSADPTSNLADILLGDIYVKQQRYREAIEIYQRAQDKQANTPVAMRLYQARSLLGEANSALQELAQWSQSRPKDMAALRALAGAYLSAGKLSTSQALHERILRETAAEQPLNAQVLNNLAWIYFQTANPRALAFAKKAYQISPKEPSILDTYGWILVQQGEYAQGLQLLREAHARTANDARVRYHLAVALHHLGRNKEAREELRLALATDTHFEGAEQALSLLNALP